MKSLLLGVCCFLLAFTLHAQQAHNDNLIELRGHNGQTYTFTTTGTTEGSLWGGANGVYTDDSRLGKAAVHAGLLRVGETGKVKVTIMAGQASYQGSTQHGITSTDYAAWSGSFRFESGQAQVVPQGVAAAPANMTNYRGQNGTVYTFRMTGSNDGSVWGGGNGIYTDDSKLSTAAVHAGVLQVGQTADVKVTVVAGQSSYNGSSQNGVKSNDYGAWTGSYSFGGAVNNGVPKQLAKPAPENMTEYRGKNGTMYEFQVTGVSSGSVWGGANGIYTDDSQLGAAAVQAGLVRVGERAVIRVRVLGGQASYQGTTKNGITSKDYGAWHGSYKFE